MEPVEIIEFLGKIEKLKCNLRHSWTSSGRQESVAEHSWRLAVIALLLKDKFPDADFNKIIKMCLVHDFGEAVTGDIPAFNKTKADEKTEQNSVLELLKDISEPLNSELIGLFNEIDEGTTREAKLLKALDKLEAVISHNEADINTWLPLEYELNLIYGKEECEGFDYMKALREQLKNNSIKKINENLN